MPHMIYVVNPQSVLFQRIQWHKLPFSPIDSVRFFNRLTFMLIVYLYVVVLFAK